MENRYNNRDFEQFVKQNADQYRMFPSEKVWEGIHNTLHTRRRWYGIGLSLLLITTGIVTWVMLYTPSDKKQPLADSKKTTASNNLAKQKIEPAEVAIIAPAKSSRIKTPAGILNNNLFISTVNMPRPEGEGVEESDLSQLQNKETAVLLSTVMRPEVVFSAPQKESVYNYNNETVQQKALPVPVAEIAALSSAHNNNIYSLADNSPEEGTVISSADVESAVSKKDIYPFTIESVVNSYQKITNRKRLSWQIYFLPTISYRKLVDKEKLTNTQQLSGSSPLNYVVANNVNNAVTHKPDIGLELGFKVGYPLGKNVRITSGLQLNVSKYDIKAYPYPLEEARIVLNNNNGSTSVSRIETNYRNIESFTKPDWLSNFYISASLPVGLEMNLTDTRKTYFGFGGTIQPNYILGDRAYLISADFKNYAKVPSLTRNWNVSTSFEVFAGYNTGKINWKVGPQVRYQLLSSFQKKYPVKEHLIDFGLKVGVMLK